MTFGGTDQVWAEIGVQGVELVGESGVRYDREPPTGKEPTGGSEDQSGEAVAGGQVNPMPRIAAPDVVEAALGSRVEIFEALLTDFEAPVTDLPSEPAAEAGSHG